MIDHFAECAAQPWALSGVHLRGLLAEALAFDPAKARSAGPARTPTRATGKAPRSISVITLRGTLMQRSTPLLSFFGGTGLDRFQSALKDALDDDSVGQILIDIDSPGGSVYGTIEAAQAVFDARKSKPVVAVANSLAASAAYWIASQADELFVIPGGEVGSIGVYAEHEDVSAALEKAGIDVTLISAGKYKVEGNNFGPLDPEARAHMQSRVDDYFGAFTRDVARGRGATVEYVRSQMGQGRVYGASQALKANMVDGVMTFDQVVQRMVRAAQVAGPRSAQGGRSALEAARNALSLVSSGDQTAQRSVAKRWLDLNGGSR